MTRRNRNRQSPNAAISGRQGPSTSVPAATPQPIPQAKPTGQVKLSAWKRFTGCYFWLRLVLWVAGKDDWLTSLGQRSAQWSISTLASFGYAPTGATHL